MHPIVPCLSIELRAHFRILSKPSVKVTLLRQTVFGTPVTFYRWPPVWTVSSFAAVLVLMCTRCVFARFNVEWQLLTAATVIEFTSATFRMASLE